MYIKSEPTLDYYSAVKRNEVLVHATEWIKLKNTQNEKNQTQKAMGGVIPFKWNTQKR